MADSDTTRRRTAAEARKRRLLAGGTDRLTSIAALKEEGLATKGISVRPRQCQPPACLKKVALHRHTRS